MRERLSDYQEQYGDLYNLEATPAESTSYRLAKHDVAQFPDIITAGDKDGSPYYTNSSHLPVGYTADIFEALDIRMSCRPSTPAAPSSRIFGREAAGLEGGSQSRADHCENYALPYYTLSPTYSICKKHGYLAGEQYTCPECGEPTEVYSRITGYYRPVQNWNDGKAQSSRTASCTIWAIPT